MPRRHGSARGGPAPLDLVACSLLALCGALFGMVAEVDIARRNAGPSLEAVALAPIPGEDPWVPLGRLVGAEPPPAAPVAPITTAPPPPLPPLPATPVRVAFLGDSVAKTMAASLQPQSGPYGISVDNRGILGCGVVRTAPFRYFGKLYDAVPPGCDTWPTTWRGSDQDKPEVAVVLVGRWELMDRVVGGRWSSIGAVDFDADVAASLDIAVATAAATAPRVVLATTPYYRRGFRPDGGTWPEDDPARVNRFNALLREAAARRPGVAVVELGNRLSVDGNLAMHIDGVRVRTDGVHVAPEAGLVLAPWLLPQLRTIAGR